MTGAELKKGVVIESGASEWQIFQQDARGEASLHLTGTCHRVRQDMELPMTFHEIESGAVTVRARIALESSGESVIPWTPCRVTDDARWEITFEHVPAGGLYRV